MKIENENLVGCSSDEKDAHIFECHDLIRRLREELVVKVSVYNQQIQPTQKTGEPDAEKQAQVTLNRYASCGRNVMSEEYEEISWKYPTVAGWLKRIKGTNTVKCLRCGGMSHINKILHFYHGHKNCKA